MSTIQQPPPATQKKLYRLPVILLPEEEGGFSVFAVTLGGACSQGETEAEALANIVEAITGLLESYQDHGQPVPWEPSIPEQHEPHALGRWVEVYA